MSYHVEYDAHRQPLGIRRERDGYLIYPHYTDSAEWKEFFEWNKTQSPPLDYTSAQTEKTEEFFALPIRTPQLITEEVILQSPIPKENPEAALTRAKDILALKDKPIGEMLFNLLVTVADLSDRLKKLEKKEKKP